MSGVRPGILVIDSRAIVRNGLLRLLAPLAEFRAVDVAANLQEAAALRRYGRHELIIAELEGPRQAHTLIDFLEGAGAGSRVIWLGASGLEDWAVAFEPDRTWGCLGESASAQEVVNAVRAVASGRRYFGGPFADALAARSCSPAKGGELSQRELAVLEQLSRGYRVAQIAENLQISAATVNTYKQRIRSKTGLRSLAEMVRYAVSQGVAGNN